MKIANPYKNQKDLLPKKKKKKAANLQIFHPTEFRPNPQNQLMKVTNPYKNQEDLQQQKNAENLSSTRINLDSVHKIN